MRLLFNAVDLLPYSGSSANLDASTKAGISIPIFDDKISRMDLIRKRWFNVQARFKALYVKESVA